MGQVSARLNRACGDAVAANPFFDYDIGVLKNFIDAVGGEMELINHVCADFVMNGGNAIFHCRFRIDNRG